MVAVGGDVNYTKIAATQKLDPVLQVVFQQISSKTGRNYL